MAEPRVVRYRDYIHETPDNPDHSFHWKTVVPEHLPVKHCPACEGRGIIPAVRFDPANGVLCRIARPGRHCDECNGEGLVPRNP